MNRKLIYYIVLPIVCICFILGGFGLSYSLKKPKTSNEGTGNVEMQPSKDGWYYINGTEKVSIVKTGSNDLVNNIDIIGVYKNKEVDALFTPKEEIQIHAKNNNDVTAEVKFEIDYLDADGNIVYYGTRNLLVMANRDFAIILELESKEKHKYETYKISYQTAKKKKGYIVFDDITSKDYSVVKTPTGNVEVAFTNNSEKSIDTLTFSCFFYKNGKEFAATTMFTSGGSFNGIAPGDGATATAYVRNYKYDYDDYKVVLSEATNYKEESERWNGDDYE